MDTNVQNKILFDKKYNNNRNDNILPIKLFQFVDKEETPIKQEEPIKEGLEKSYKEKEDFGIINKDDLPDVEDILNLNNKIQSINDELLNNNDNNNNNISNNNNKTDLNEKNVLMNNYYKNILNNNNNIKENNQENELNINMNKYMKENDIKE